MERSTRRFSDKEGPNGPWKAISCLTARAKIKRKA